MAPRRLHLQFHWQGKVDGNGPIVKAENNDPVQYSMSKLLQQLIKTRHHHEYNNDNDIKETFHSHSTQNTHVIRLLIGMKKTIDFVFTCRLFCERENNEVGLSSQTQKQNSIQVLINSGSSEAVRANHKLCFMLTFDYFPSQIYPMTL